MKRIVMMLLTVCMLLSLLAGCGSGSAAQSSASAAGETAQVEASVQTEAEAPQENEDSDSALPEAAVPAEEASAAETETEAATMEIPLPDVAVPLTDEETTITYWTSLDPRINDYLPAENVEDVLLAYGAIRDITGVNIHLVTVSVFAQTEQFQLMVAGGDYCDIIYGVEGQYASKSFGAIEDGVIMDLADLLQENAPDVYDYFMSEPELKVTLFNTEGEIGSIPIVYKEAGLEREGMVYRSDWSEEFGIGEITTLEQYHDYLVQARENYNAYAFTNSGASGSGYTTVDSHACQALGAYNDYYQIDGEVLYGPVQDSYYDYIDTMRQWYEEGLFADEMLTNDLSTYQQGFGVGKYSSTGVNGAAGITELYGYSYDADGNKTIEVGALGDYLSEGVDSLLVSSKNTLIKESTWSVSVDCENPELICRLINWLYTEQGSLTSTYGVEGETYTLDADGNPQYTDMILHNEDGYNTTITINMYATANVPGFFDQRRVFFDFDEVQEEAVELFRGPDENVNNIPDAAESFLNDEEQSELANARTEYETYLEEQELSFIMGKTELNEETWNAYVDGMYAAGLQDAIDLQQTAYDRYMERVNS